MHRVIVVLVTLALAACAMSQQRGTAGTQLSLGRSVFEQTCAVCHSVNPPAVAAPPMSHIAGHYLDEIPDTAAAARRLAAWIAAPAQEKSLLPPHAIERWGVMPPLALPERERLAVAAYVLTLAGDHRPGMEMGGAGMGGGAQHRHGARENVPPRIETLVTSIGEPAAGALRTGLMQRLTTALAEGSPAEAIDVCALEALPLTDSIAAASEKGIALRRTSTRVRNPSNAPDAQELEALAWFADELADGRSPTRYVQADGGDWRYYEPLRVARPCLTCHGRVEAMSPEVRRALRNRYPDDRATGYAEGDLRGVIRVSVPASAIR